jgi:hypothetical protein
MTVETSGASVEAAESTPAPLSAEDQAAISGGEFSEEEIAQLRGEPKAGEKEQAAGEGGEKAPQEAQDGAEKSERPDSRTVPIQALHEARSELKTLREEVGKFKEWQNAIAQRLIEQRAQQERAEQEELNRIPDVNQDPLAKIEWTAQQIQEMQRRDQEREAQQRQYYEQQQAIRQTVAHADEVVNEAIRQDPVVADAMLFATQALREEVLRLKGRNGWTTEQAEAAYRDAVYNYAASAPSTPEEMREHVFRNARYWGWTPQQQATQQSDAGKGPTDAIQKLEKLQGAVNASKTLSGGGAANGGEMTLADLEGMSGEELERFASANPDLFDKIAGFKK